MALGAAYGGAIGVTHDLRPGPGAQERDDRPGGDASSCRSSSSTSSAAGPSTGLPTKTEQADLLQAMFGRNGEAPVPIVAPRSPADCFDAALEAVRIATTYRTPVLLLSDGYLANGSEPWLVPDVGVPARPAGGVRHAAQRTGRGPVPPVRPRSPDPRPAVGAARRRRASSTASAASRRPTAPARSPTTRTTTTTWSGCARRRSTASTSPPLEVDDPAGDAETARRRLGLDLRADRGRRPRGPRGRAARSRPRTCDHLNPFPANTGEVLRRYRQVLVPEMNLGQLATAAARPLPGRRRRLQPGPRGAVHVGRARRRHPQARRGGPAVSS